MLMPCSCAPLSSLLKTDTVCDSQWGVGLSSGLRGTMNNLDDDAFHDAFMIAHEIGHSLVSYMDLFSLFVSLYSNQRRTRRTDTH